MVLWNAIPWNTIGIVLAISIIIPSILTIILIRKNRFEEIGWAIGLFLIILGLLAYFYIIPYEVVDEAVIPKDYIWEDIGDIHYWERNTVVFPDEVRYSIPARILDALVKKDPIEKNFRGKEVIHVADYDSYKKTALINDAFYDENGEILRVINGREEVSEWYEIDSHLDNLEYVNVEAGHMGIPSNYNDKNVIRVGWVSSNGKQKDSENVVLIRDMKKIKSGAIDGVELSVWQSDIYNTPINWHGETYFCDETLRLTVHTRTGYIVHVYRHLVLSARLSQFIQIYHPELLRYRFINRFLKNTNPVGEAAELIYETIDESRDNHIAEAKLYDNLLLYIPILICLPIFLVGVALFWRYYGRSYYWRRYKDYELVSESTLKEIDHRSSSRLLYKTTSSINFKKGFAFMTCVILLSLSIFYFILIPVQKGENLFFVRDSEDSELIEEIPPSPPGSHGTADSGRHTLEPQDEGAHRISQREWWYFNVFFDNPASDLKNWSMIISFNKMARTDMRLVRRDNLHIVLYDDKGESYEYSILNKRRGTLKAGQDGVDVTFQKCWARGQYPFWQVHVEDDSRGIVVDFNFTADFMPVWVIGRSSNLIINKYMSGNYYIPRCKVEGTVLWNNKEHFVYGKGYHDHVWDTYVPRFVTDGWDWITMHFDNGWEMYLSKFKLRFNLPIDKLTGTLIISPNNREIVEWAVFKLEIIETAKADKFLSMQYPTRFRVEASRDDMILKLDIVVYNTYQKIWRIARTGMFEGPSYAKGSFSWGDNTVELNGYGMSESTRVKYFIDNFRILNRFYDRLFNFLERN
jgi:hypothetical protein